MEGVTQEATETYVPYYRHVSSAFISLWIVRKSSTQYISQEFCCIIHNSASAIAEISQTAAPTFSLPLKAKYRRYMSGTTSYKPVRCPLRQGGYSFAI